MRIPLTKYGYPQLLIFPAIVLVVMIVLAVVGSAIPPVFKISLEMLLFVVLVWILCFFRDPDRKVVRESDVLLAPADGTVTDIETVGDIEGFDGPVLRIGIFLSIFNVHINRMPCRVRVEKVTYKKGLYKNAMNPQSGRVNESNDITMTRLDKPCDRLLVRQISGAIARRIVCLARAGQDFAGGQDFGMIKFGSRTELYLPVTPDVSTLVEVGDKVKAGLTVLVRYQKCPNSKSKEPEKETCSDVSDARD